jgi:hypothetical protein
VGSILPSTLCGGNRGIARFLSKCPTRAAFQGPGHSDLFLFLPRKHSEGFAHKDTDASDATIDRRGDEAKEAWLFALNSNARNFALTLFSRNRSTRLATIRIERIFRDHQTKGFFKIGALPFVVADNTSVRLHDSDEASSLLRRLHTADTNSRNEKHAALEIRNLRITFDAYPEWRLSAANARPMSSGRLRLRNVVLHTEAGARHLARQGDLFFTPDGRGRIRLSGSLKEHPLPTLTHAAISHKNQKLNTP